MVGESLNLDELPTPRIEDRINEARRLKGLAGIDWRRYRNIDTGLYRHSVGFSPERLRDWRGLERRQHELRDRLVDTSRSFWGTLQRLHALAIERGTKEVWIRGNTYRDTGFADVLVFNGQSYGWQDSDKMIKECIGDPDKKALVLNDVDSDAVMRLRQRDDTLRKRQGTYQHAFQLAVEFRLQPFVREKLTNHERNYTQPCTFIISNDDRYYTIYLGTDHVLKWQSQPTLYACR